MKNSLAWALAISLLFACSDSDGTGLSGGTAKQSGPERDTQAVVPLAPGSQADLVLVALDGLRLDDAWADPEVAPFLSDWMARALAPETMIGSASGLNSAVASLLTGLSPTEHGLASLRDPFGQKLPPAAWTLAEDLSEKGWQPVASVAEPQLRAELSGLAQGFLDWVAPTLDPRVFLEASNIGALGSNQLRDLKDKSAPVFLFLEFADLARENTPDPAAAIVRLEKHLKPHLGRLPHVRQALDEGRLDPQAGLEKVASLLGRARGSGPYLAWRRALREARLGAIDRALSQVLETLQDLGRGRDVLLCLTSLRGAPLAPPQARVRPAFLPDQMRVVARVGSLQATQGRRLHGVFDLTGLSTYCRRALLGGGPHEPIAAVLVQDPDLERFGAFGRDFHLEEHRLTERVLWDGAGQLQDLESHPGPVAVLSSSLVQRPQLGWRFVASSEPLDLRWRVMEGTLRPAQVRGLGSTASARGVRGQAHLESGGQVDLLGGARSQNWVLHVSASDLSSGGPWSGGVPALKVTAEPTPWEGDAPHPILTEGSGWARLELPPGGEFEVWMVRHPARMREPFPLEWAADVDVTVERRGDEGIYARGEGAAVIQLGLPPKRECALAIRRDGHWLNPWEIEAQGNQLGSTSGVRLLLTPQQRQEGASKGVLLENLTPQPVFGPLDPAPGHALDFIHALPPSE